MCALGSVVIEPVLWLFFVFVFILCENLDFLNADKRSKALLDDDAKFLSNHYLLVMWLEI